jgi:hypothetical protein
MNLHATANSQGEIFIHVNTEKGEATTFELNYFLKTQLYRSGYPAKEENRLKDWKSVLYNFNT